MLTALDTTDDIVMGLHAGADDYIVKPFKFMELLARIQAMLRRSDATKSTRSLVFADLHLDPASHKAIRGSREVDLSIKEYRLLEYMMEHHGEILSRRQLLKNVWNKDFDTNTNIVDVYVRYLRNKIDDDFKQKLIHTVVGTGYCLRAEEP
jgi:DNA-binding response OmpR family regulator